MIITEEQKLQLHDNHISELPDKCVLYNKSTIKQRDLDGWLKESYPNVSRTTDIQECNVIITSNTWTLYRINTPLKVTFKDNNDSFIFYGLGLYINSTSIYQYEIMDKFKEFRPETCEAIEKVLQKVPWLNIKNFFELNPYLYKVEDVTDYIQIIDKDFFNTKILHPSDIIRNISKWKYSTREKVDDQLFNNIIELVNGDLKTGLRVAKNMDLSGYLLEMLHEYFIKDKRNIGKLIKQYHPEFLCHKSKGINYDRFINNVQDFYEEGYEIDKDKFFKLLIDGKQ